MAPPGDDINDRNTEVVPSGDDTDVAPPGDTDDRNNEVAPPGEGENQGLHTSPPSASDQVASPSVPVMVSEASHQNLAPSLQHPLVTEFCRPSIYIRSIILQEGVNVSDNVTVSTSESRPEALESQDPPEEDAEQLQGQPLNLQSPHRGEISLHAEQNVYNPYHNMRLIMNSELGQSSSVGPVPPAANRFLSERHFNMEEIVSIWENSDDLYRRDQLLNRFIENSLYRPNIVQRGGYLTLLQILNDIMGGTRGDAHALRDAEHGVLLNNQDCLEPSNGHFRLGHEYLSIDHYNKMTVRCCLRNRDFNFIRKTYCDSDWCGEQMIVPFLCGSRSIVQPLGLTWGGREIQVFLPVIQGESLTDVLTHCDRGLTQPEVTLLTYQLLQIVSILQRRNCLHRNITPDNVIISQENQCLYLIGNRALCRLQNALSTIPSNLSLYTAPELARGEEHPRADLYSAGCTMISALKNQIPFFDINGIQRTRRNYLYNIGLGLFSPTAALNAAHGIDDFLRDVLDAMVTPGQSAEEILRSYFRNQGREPVWSDSFFQPSPPDVPDMRRAEVQNEEHLNIPSEEILLSASDQVETIEDETIDEMKYDDGDSHLDSGLHASISVEFCTVVVFENGMEVCTLSLPWGEHAQKVYKEINAKMKLSHEYILQHNGQIVKFDKQLHELPKTHPTMPLLLHLHRLDTKKDHRPSELGSRSNQRSGSQTVVEGAAYNGDDHVVYDDPVQTWELSSMTRESDALFDSSDFDAAAEGASHERQVPALTETLASPGTGLANSGRSIRSRGMCAFEDATEEDVARDASVISDEQFILSEDNEYPEEDELQVEVGPEDTDDGDEEGSQNTDEENADDMEQNHLLDEGGEAVSDFRSANMNMFLEEEEEALIEGIGEEGGRDIKDAESDASVCGDSQTCSEENFIEDEADAGNEEDEGIPSPCSRNQPMVSVDSEGSDSESDDKVASDVDSGGNGSESDENDEGGDSGLTGDATESSSFSDVGVTVTNEASTPMSEECGPLEDEECSPLEDEN